MGRGRGLAVVVDKSIILGELVAPLCCPGEGRGEGEWWGRGKVCERERCGS